MLCGSLDGREVWGRKDTYICIGESLCCSSETITALFFVFFLIFVYLFLAVLGLCCCRQAFASCGAWPSCDGSSACGTVSRRTGSVVVALRLSCSEACGIFLDQGSNPFPLAGRFLTAGPPGKPPTLFRQYLYTCIASWDFSNEIS